MSKYEIKEFIDKNIYKTYNLLAKIKFLFSKDKEIASKNIKFKNIHKGDSCYILGTGPSLKDLDLKFLENEIVFGLNYLYRSKNIKGIKPKYYCLYDEIFHSTRIEDTMKILRLYPDSTFFVRTKAYNNFQRNSIKNENIYYQPCNVFQYGDFISVDMTKSMTAPYNVVLGCIQTAIYMGFKNIYLLGCDYNSFASLKVEHSYDEDVIIDRKMTLGYEMKYYTMCTYHHYALEKYAKRNNINIYNLTDNSLLDAYKRIGYSEHIKCNFSKKRG